MNHGTYLHKCTRCDDVHEVYASWEWWYCPKCGKRQDKYNDKYTEFGSTEGEWKEVVGALLALTAVGVLLGLAWMASG